MGQLCDNMRRRMTSPDARPLIRRSIIMVVAAGDAPLRKRTLTSLYNERPQWLRIVHETLDRAVLAAYAASCHPKKIRRVQNISLAP